MWIYGAGGHGKVILDILKAQQVPVCGFIDDDPVKIEFLGLPVYRYEHIKQLEDKIIIGIGSNYTRMKVVFRVSNPFNKAVHPSSIVSRNSDIGNGTVIMPLAVLQTDTTIGKHCIINTSSSVDHDCTIGDFVHVSPGATICGNVEIGDLTWVGAGATIIQGISIGKNVIIGAGTVILNNIPDNVLVVGNPASIKKMIPKFF